MTEPSDIEVPSWLQWIGNFSGISVCFAVVDYIATWLTGIGPPDLSKWEVFVATVPLTATVALCTFLVLREGKGGRWDGQFGTKLLWAIIGAYFLWVAAAAILTPSEPQCAVYPTLTPGQEETSVPGALPPCLEIGSSGEAISRAQYAPNPWTVRLGHPLVMPILILLNYWTNYGPILFIKALILGAYWGRSLHRNRLPSFR